jgi:O-antigen/teichoic acid export membrane protein
MVLSTVVTNFGIQAATIAASILSARILGAQGRGELALVLLYPQLVAQLLLVGCDRAIAVASGRSRVPPVHPVLAVSFLLSVPAIGVGYAVVGLRLHDPQLELLSSVYLSYVFPSYVFILTTFAYNGLGDFRRYNQLRLVFYGANLAALVAIFVIQPEEALIPVVAANLVSVFVAFAAAILCMARDFPRALRSAEQPKAMIASILTMGAAFAPSGMLAQLALSIPQIILEVTQTPLALGGFVVFLSYARIPAPLGNAIATHLLHRGIAGRHADAARLIRVSVLAFLLFAIPLLALGRLLVPMVFGPSFQPTLLLLALLLLAGLLSTISDSAGEYLKGRRLLRADVAGRLLQVTILVSVGFAIVPSSGLLGLALAMTIAEALRVGIVLAACGRAAGQTLDKFVLPSTEDLKAVCNSIFKLDRR